MMSTTPSSSQKEKMCSIHQDRPVICVCLHPGCAQLFLCLNCNRKHPDDHLEIYELSSLRIQTQLKDMEKKLADDANSKLHYINTQKDQIGSHNKELIINMTDKIIKDIQDKTTQLLDNATPEEDDTTRGLFSRLESNLKVIGNFELSGDLFENITQIKAYNEEKLPAAKNLIKEAEKIWDTWKLHGSKLDLYEKELGCLIANLQLIDFLPNSPFKSLMQLEIPDSLKTDHLDLGVKSKVNILDEEVMKLKQDNERLTKELAYSVQANDQCELDNRQMESLSEENQALKTQITNLEKEKTAIKNDLNILKEQNELEKKQMQSQASSLSDENQTLKSQAKTLCAQIGNLEKEKTTLENGFNALKEQNKLENQQVQSQASSLSKENQDLKAQITDMAKEKTTLEKGLHVLKEQSKLEKQQLQNQASSLSDENQTLKTQAKTLCAQIGNLEKEKTTLNDNLNVLKDQVKNEKTNREKDLEQWKKSMKQKENEINGFQEKEQSLDAEIGDLEEELDRLKDENGFLRDLLREAMRGTGCREISLDDGTWCYYCEGINNGCDASGKVWGSNSYTSDSNPCKAALHSGAIDEEGGIAYRELGGPLDWFTGTKKNGVSTKEYGYYESTHHYSSIYK